MSTEIIYNTDFNFMFDDLLNTTSNSTLSCLCATPTAKPLSETYSKTNYNQSLKVNMFSDVTVCAIDENDYVSGDDTITQDLLMTLASDTGSDFIYPTLGSNFRTNTMGMSILNTTQMQHQANFAGTAVKNTLNIYLSEFNTTYHDTFNSDLFVVDINVLNTISGLTLSPSTIGYNTVDVAITGTLADDTTIETTTLTTAY